MLTYGTNVYTINIAFVVSAILYIVVSGVNFNKYAYNHLTQGDVFLSSNINELLDDDNLKAHDAQRCFFDRLIISQEDYENFLKRSD